MMDPPLDLLILGLGNLLCGDDGAGVAAITRLARDHEEPEGVRILDGGTLGLALLPWIRSAKTVLLVDAVLADAPPGTIVRIEGDEVTRAVAQRLSVHQVGVADLLDGARLLGGLPERVILIGIVPGQMNLEVALSPAVAEGLGALVDATIAEAKAVGFALAPREDSVNARSRVGHGGAAVELLELLG